MLPDIAQQPLKKFQSPIDWVGMNEVQFPVKFNHLTLPAKWELLVNLIDKETKGIHMSRLYLETQKYIKEEIFNFSTLQTLAQKCIDSQGDISTQSQISVRFDLPVEKPALKSDNAGYLYYPMQWCVEKQVDGTWIYQLDITLTYSSTCPCSAALSRQILQQNIDAHFSDASISKEELLDWIGQEENQSATPHSQRSNADISLNFKAAPENKEILSMIERLEESLQTRVQTAVKRADEQEFARKNANNLMFSEDAARRLKQALESEKNVKNYELKVHHFESLHPHDAVAIISG